ncbi:MAG TPA: hypothetical protein VG269_25075 [Tepidisphaeraceae bacterium]|jgi:hypothetical protein|nr:hypothetical protein [Tepidisphaeraceae bacterium]
MKLDTAIFRAGRQYELIELRRLSSEQRRMLGVLPAEADLFGILRPRAGVSVPAKTVCRNSALLYLSLLEPGLIPQCIVSSVPNVTAFLSGLVLNGVLEILQGEQFVTGSDASQALGLDAEMGDLNPIAQLSLAGVQYAESLTLSDMSELTSRLYCFNRKPLSIRWMRDIPDESTLLNYVGASGDKSAAKLLRRHWEYEGSQTGWHVWRRGPSEPLQRQFKVYLSPQPEAIAPVFRALVELAIGCGVHCFKIGAGPAGILRPDKLVAYLQNFESLIQLVRDLKSSTAGCPVQGVPFTACATPDGLVSWGIDPPDDGAIFPQERPQSWRVWVASCLAEALLQAQGRSSNGCQPWEFAICKMRSIGIDPQTWLPPATEWTLPPA